MAKESAEEKYLKLKKHNILSGVGGVLFLTLDVVLFGAPLLGTFVLLYVIFYLAPVTLFSLKNKPKMKFFGSKAIIYTLTFVLSLGFFQFDMAEAGERAEQVIEAVERYHSENKTYPPSLEALVPKYLPAIPKPRKVYPSKFMYVGLQNGEPHLMYVSYPPFERTSWSFKEKQWKVID